MAHLTREDQAKLAKRLIDIPWCVYAPALHCEVFCCAHTPHSHHPARIEDCPAPFDRQHAAEFAGRLREIADGATRIHGAGVPEIAVFVLWHGIVWVRR